MSDRDASHHRGSAFGTPVARYGFAIGAAVAAALLRLPFQPILGDRAPFAVFYVAVVIVAWYCGAIPTAVTTVLSLLLSWYFFISPKYSWAISDPADVGALLFNAAICAALAAMSRTADRVRREAEDALATVERDQRPLALLAAIIDSSEDAIVSKSTEGIIQTWNAAAERLFGYSANEAVGKPIHMLVPAERVREEDEVLQSLRDGQKLRNIETVRRTKDGRLLEVSLTISPIRDAAGNIIGASKIARDITERKRFEHALAEQREWFRVTLSSIGDAVIASDRDGCVTFMNQIAEELTGWTGADAQGKALKQVFDIFNEETREPVENPVEKVVRYGRVLGLANHTVLRSRDGREYPIADSAAPILDDEKKIVGAVLVFRDVTELRRAEIAEQQLAEQRERALANERVARAEAEKANRLKDEFVATISHELRTPLTAILGWTHMLQQKPEDSEYVKRGLSVIDRSARMQTQLVSDLLDVSRIIAGKLRLELQPVDLASVVQGAVETQARAAELKRIHIEQSVDQTMPLIVGDPARLQQVVWNLLGNAIKFTPAGGHVEVVLRRGTSAIEIAVSDSGIGIKPEFLSRLFDRFTQADGSSSRPFGGLGLGLSIVKEIVSLHGGTVSAESAGEGQGATFTVCLPLVLAETEGQRTHQDADSEPPSSVDAAKIRGLRILLVEDEPDTRSFLQQVLEQYGAVVTTAPDANTALQQFEEHQPDLLLCDIGLPGMDGLQLIRTVRTRPVDKGGAVPAIAVTAFAGSDDRKRALSAGYQGHLPKPVDANELITLIASFTGLLPRTSA